MTMKHTEEIKKINEQISQRFNRIEAGINATRDIPALFETLFSGIQKEFDIPFVWVALIDRQDTASMIAAVEASETLKNRFCVLSAESFGSIIPDVTKPVLANRNLQPCYRLLPPARKYFIKSLAMVPFELQGRIAGVWNCADPSAERFTPEMETDLLAAFGRALSRRLTELAAGSLQADLIPKEDVRDD